MEYRVECSTAPVRVRVEDRGKSTNSFTTELQASSYWFDTLAAELHSLSYEWNSESTPTDVLVSV